MEKCFSKCSARICFGTIINDLSDRLTSICKIFADDRSLFSKAINNKKSEIEPNKDFKLINPWAYQWKMLCFYVFVIYYTTRTDLNQRKP